MRRFALLAFLLGLIVAIVGCGGQAGRNSPTQVRLETDAGTTDFSALHVIISPNNGSAVSIEAVSDLQTQTWATQSSGPGFKEIDFTTTSQRVPYFVYLQNTSGASQTVRLRILMDGDEKLNQVFTVNAGATTQVETIFRNNIQD